MENKLNSTRKITVDRLDRNQYGRVGLIYLEDTDNLYKHPLFKIPLLEENFGILDKWNQDILSQTGDEEYYQFARRGGIYIDYAFVKLKMEYDPKNKLSTNIVRSVIKIDEIKQQGLSLEEVQKHLLKSKKVDITIKASSLYNHKDKKGIKYLIEQIDFTQ